MNKIYKISSLPTGDAPRPPTHGDAPPHPPPPDDDVTAAPQPAAPHDAPPRPPPPLQPPYDARHEDPKEPLLGHHECPQSLGHDGSLQTQIRILIQTQIKELVLRYGPILFLRNNNYIKKRIYIL